MDDNKHRRLYDERQGPFSSPASKEFIELNKIIWYEKGYRRTRIGKTSKKVTRMAESLPDNDNTVSPEQWVDLYGDYLYRYALFRVSDAETAQELVQEAFVGAVSAYKRFRGQSTLKTWLVAILKRKIVDYYRRRNTQKNVTVLEPETERSEPLFDETGHWQSMPGQWQFNPGAAYEQKEFMDILYDCLANLPNRLSEIFMLREFEELDTETICLQMQITESNSWVMLYRARMHLKKCLEANWIGETT